MKWGAGDLEVTHIKGSGPGGQNKNKRMSGIRVCHLPTGIVAEATERRSQFQNLEMALERLEIKIERFYYRPPSRVKTKVSNTQKKRRIESKKHRSLTKSHRNIKHRHDSE